MSHKALCPTCVILAALGLVEAEAADPLGDNVPLGVGVDDEDDEGPSETEVLLPPGPSHWTNGHVVLLSVDRVEYAEGVVTISRSKSVQFKRDRREYGNGDSATHQRMFYHPLLVHHSRIARYAPLLPDFQRSTSARTAFRTPSHIHHHIQNDH